MTDEPWIGFDTETSGTIPEYALQPWRRATKDFWVTSLVWIDETGRVHGGLKPELSEMRRMLTYAIEKRIPIVGWNLVFDIQVLMAYGLTDLCFKVRWLDGMLLYRHVDIEPEYDVGRPQKKSYGLKPCVALLLPEHADYAEDVDFHDPSPEARAKLHAYNIRDVEFTLHCARHFYRQLNPRQLAAALIEAQCLPLVAQANLNGMLVDTLACRELQQWLADKAAASLEKLQWLGITEKVVRSPIQLGKVLFDEWKLPVLKENTSKLTGKITRSTDKEVLHELAFIDARAKEVREYRESLNNRTKFADTPLAAAAYNGDGRARPAAIVFGTYSGRLTYSSKQGKNKDERQTGFALHQEKRGKEFRGIIIPPPGHTLMEFDAAGQEFRWMAIASGDETMLGLCAPGEDPHAYMGAAIEITDYRRLIAAVAAAEAKAKEIRQLGKVANLCVAKGTRVLTDRGFCNIEHVRPVDRVWDGVEFVSHDGVVCSGVKPVVTYSGVTATPDHKVLVGDSWVRLDEAARYGWTIKPSLGEGWACIARSVVRVVDGVVRRAVSEVGCALRASAVHLWGRARRQLGVLGDGALYPMQGLRDAPATCSGGQSRDRLGGRQKPPEAGQRVVSALPQPEGSFVAQLRRSRDRVSIRVGQGGCGLYPSAFTPPNLPSTGYRPGGQRGPLRAGKPAISDTQGESRQQTAEVYDIVNCGPRTRFAANGLIVHNSLQYRTSAKKLRVVARVQYDMPMELPQAELIWKTYQRTYPKVPAYWKFQIAQTKQTGYVETFAGRRVRVEGDWTGSLGWSMGSTAINYRIQGTGADQKYLALAVIRSYLLSISAHFAWDLHDGIYLYVPDEQVPAAAKEIKRLLDNLPYKQAWGFEPPISLPWDCKVGKSWGSLKDYKFEEK